MTLWTAAGAAAATGGQPRGDWAATGVSIDSRTLQPGDLFVALTAARDGHDFVAAAFEKGAAAAMVSRIPEGVDEAAPLLVVADVQAGLEALGRAARARTRARIAAVTGSAGKTSTKDMLVAMLSGQGRVHASAASYNNHWGVPLTLVRMPEETDFAVIEIGMNHPGEIAPLARQARPHVALITTVAPAHLEAFDSVEAIAAEKAAIMEGLVAGGTAVLNADIPQAGLLFDRAAALGVRAVDLGRRAGDWRLRSVSVTGGAMTVRAGAQGRALSVGLQAEGTHFAANALGALAVCVALGADPDLSAQGLGGWRPGPGRGARETVPLPGGGALELIDDAYNANPASMAAALELLAGAAPVPGGRRIAIIGDMRELGAQAGALHAALADLPAMKRIDRVHCVGPVMRALHAALPAERRGDWCETGAEMAAGISARTGVGDIVLVKASLGTGLATVVDAIRKMGHGAPRTDANEGANGKG